MNKVFRKIIAVICAMAMIVSSITVYNQTEVKAEQSGTFDGVTYTVNGETMNNITGFVCQLITTQDGVDSINFAWGTTVNTDYTVTVGDVTLTSDDLQSKKVRECKIKISSLADFSAGEYQITFSGTTVATESAESVEFTAGATLTITKTTTTVLPVTSVTATGKVNSIDVSWTPQDGMPEGTQYYVYLDDAETESAIVTDATTTTLTNVSAGYHTVKVKVCVGGVFSDAVESPQANVTAEETRVTNLAVSATTANQVEVSLDAVTNASYTIELVNSEGTTVATITECTVADDKATCTFTNVEKGTYTVKATITVGDETDSKTSDAIDVKDPEAQEVDDIEFDTTTYNTIVATWTVKNNQPVENQKYKVYLDGEYVTEVSEMTYTFANVETGKHTVKVTGTLDDEETAGREEEVVATAAPITVMDIEINQVTNYNNTYSLNDTWSYEYPIISTDCYLGTDDKNNIIAYSPLNRGQSNFIYQYMTGLEAGKYYTYSYTVIGSEEGMADIPVHVYSEVSQVDHTVTPGTSDKPTVNTRTFYADTSNITVRYDVGGLAAGTAVKISPITVKMVEPSDVKSVTAYGRIDAVEAEWVKSDDTVIYQTFNLYLTDEEGTEIAKATDLTSTYYKFTNLEEGKYKVTIKGAINGKESEGVTSETVSIGGVTSGITSSEIAVEGFQIKTNDIANQTSVAFRTICKAPNVGSEITGSDGNTYTVQSMGTIYAIDTNYTGYKKNNHLVALYTFLDSEAVDSTVQEKYGYKYVGANKYEGNNRTKGYIATEIGISNDWNASDTTHTYYVRTMEGMDEQMAYSMHVRAFVVATDADGNEVFIYGESTAVSSVAQIADYLYKNSMSRNYSAHKYLYTNILNSDYLKADEAAGRETNNVYYRDVALDYGWNGILYVPGSTAATLTTNTLEALNKAEETE